MRIALANVLEVRVISKLKGFVDSIFDDSIIVDISGVGYAVFITTRLLSTIKMGDKIEIKTYHAFKAEQQFLCGFESSNELILFKNLLEVPGIGIKSAMAILSKLSSEELAIAIATQDSDVLLNVSGIGKKSAARILLELKDKTILKAKDGISSEKTQTGNINDAMLGLISLGYQKHQAMNTITKIIKTTENNIPTNELIVLCLKELQ